MDVYLIIARSVTYAQRMQRALEQAGIRCRIFRAPRELSETGCAYTVEISSADLTQALQCLYKAQLAPVQIYLSQRGHSREVAP